jgi:hypothetical protein
MADPQIPKHDPVPLDPKSDGDNAAPPDPDDGKDLNYLVPHVSVIWDTPPSFNLEPPPDDSTAGVPVKPSDLTGSFSVDLASMRTGEQSMLSSLRTDTNQYESLRSAVESAVSNPTTFGPAYADPNYQPYQKIQNTGKEQYGANIKPTGDPNATEINQIAEMGQQFAAAINPAQEKVLKSIGDVLELAGTFVAMINKSGQSYSQTDRSAKFPDPPGGSPVT